MTDEEVDAAAKFPPPPRERLLDLTSANSITKKSVTAQNSSYLGVTAEFVKFMKEQLNTHYSRSKYWPDKKKAALAVPIRFVVKLIQDWFSMVDTISNARLCSAV